MISFFNLDISFNSRFCRGQRQVQFRVLNSASDSKTFDHKDFDVAQDSGKFGFWHELEYPICFFEIRIDVRGLWASRQVLTKLGDVEINGIDLRIESLLLNGSFNWFLFHFRTSEEKSECFNCC